MKTSSKTYRVVCKTDLYHASRKPNFNSNGEWCEPEWRGLSLKEANALLLKFFKESAGQYFDNWGLAVIWSKRPHEPQDVTCCTCSDGTRAFDDDIYQWRTEEEEDED